MFKNRLGIFNNMNTPIDVNNYFVFIVRKKDYTNHLNPTTLLATQVKYLYDCMNNLIFPN